MHTDASSEYPRIQHHGAVTGVTGSCHQLWLSPTHSLLIDCGLFQGGESGPGGAGSRSLDIEFDISSVVALVVTHVHIDHIGRMPWLLAAGFKGPILCTEPSAVLMPAMLEDAFKVGISRQGRAVERYLQRIDSVISGTPYKEWLTVLDTPDVVCRIRFQRAGHILGSAWVECDLHYPLEQRKKRIVFSGDLGAPHSPLLPPPEIPYRADTVVLESTYGNRQHENRKTRRKRLQRAIEGALKNGGTVLIPAFSLGRTQELLYELGDILRRAPGQGIHAPDWHNLPVILDSPLANKLTELYRQLKPWWDAEALKQVAQGQSPLDFCNLLRVETHAQHQAMVNRLAHSGRPAIVISGSGMCTAGRIVNYLKAMLPDPRHHVIFVGYQSAGTNGRAIQQAGQGGQVELDGELIEVAAGIDTIGGYSAHADQAGLVGFITRMRKWPQEVVLVHGDRQAKETLARVLLEQSERKGTSLQVRIG